tara:strand:- start:596 stop:1075 length:480 start_codon:yes stop_codon:yes gene_type:complete
MFGEIMMRTFTATPVDITNKWYLVNAEGLVLGRLAALIASRIRGKHKPIYTPHMDCGDHIVVINARDVHMTAGKLNKKIHYWHTGYPGGIKSKTYNEIIEGANPEKLLRSAVKRMMPSGPLGRSQLKKLHIYAGSEHPHQAHSPETIDFALMNKKNKKA